MIPVLCVHGIWDDSRVFDPMREHLSRAGFQHVVAVDLTPNGGQAGIARLAAQVALAAEDLLAKSGQEQLDVVGFSMGALVTRYWIQRLGGRRRARRFVSISGPHRGSWLAALAFDALGDGIRDMRPRSDLLTDLAKDPDPWGQTEVIVFRTPFDLMVLPSTSATLEGAKERVFSVALHGWMLSDKRVLDALVAELA